MTAIAATLEAATHEHACPHMAVLLDSEDELPAVLASFYDLGARRGGWLAHRCRRGEADRDRAALRDAGLALDALEGSGSLAIVEFDPAEAPERSTDPWSDALDEALGRGHRALWYSRFAVGRDPSAFNGVLAFERAWEARFADRPVVTLCPYVVGALPARNALERVATLAAIHDTVLVPGPSGFEPMTAPAQRAARRAG